MSHWEPSNESVNQATRAPAGTRGRHGWRVQGRWTRVNVLWRAGRGADRGSVSVWIATGGVVMIVLVGMAVDLGGQVYAQQHARDVARQAARAGGQQLQAAAAIRGRGALVDPAVAVRAARTYLAASDVTGSATVSGGDTVVVDTTAVYTTKFLSIIGLNRLTVTGHAAATTTRAAGGVQR
ncbi:MAG TPA: TadE family protein [Dermatophilaceae bacterium]|nr:TadE family protein [Dermatophilaceae bacterium]